MKKEPTIKIYIPDKDVHTGIFAIWKEMFVEILESRELIWRLFIRDFNARYKQSVLGLLWVLIMPFVVVGVFVYLNKGGILHFGDIDVPYPVFALFGLSVWTIFSTGLTATSNSLLMAGPMVIKINFPKATLVIAAMGQALVESLVRFGLLGVVFAVYRISPHRAALLLPLTLLPLYLLTLGIGFFLSLATGVMRDIPNIVMLATTFLMFVCPVAYPLPKIAFFAGLDQWNPLSQLINASRDIVFKGFITDSSGFIWSSVFSLMVFLVGARVFYIAQTKIAERI